MPAGTVTPTTTDAEFAAFLQSAEPAARQLLRRLSGNTLDADDILQETMAKVWRLRASFDPRQNGAAWLQQAAFRCFCDHRRRRHKSPRTTPADDATPAPTRPCATELRDELHHRLAVLSPLERDLLLAFHGRGQSLRELAAAYTLPINTIKSHLHRARRRLQEQRPEAP